MTAVVGAKPPDPSKLPRKNGKPIYMVETLPVVPGTLAGMYDVAEAIVDVRINSSAGKLVPGDRPHTLYTATVLRAFKGELKPRQTLVFSQAAGEVELPDRIVQASDPRTLSVGGRYIVFIRYHAPYESYILIGGRETAFKVSNGRIEPGGEGNVAAEQQNLTERQFTDELEMIARRAVPKH
jgi:hypothetical protein